MALNEPNWKPSIKLYIVVYDDDDSNGVMKFYFFSIGFGFFHSLQGLRYFTTEESAQPKNGWLGFRHVYDFFIPGTFNKFSVVDF